MLYRSKPTTVLAVLWTGDEEAITESDFFGVTFFESDGSLSLYAGKDGAQGWVPVPLGHWLVRNPFDITDNWPVENDYFADKYEAVV